MRRNKVRFGFIKVGTWLLRLAALAMLGYVFWLVYDYAFSIKSIHCDYQQKACPAEVVAELERLTNESIIFVDKQSLSSKIIGANPAYVAAEIETALPGSLSLQLRQAQDIAQIGVATDSAVLVISENFVVTNYLDQLDPRLSLIVAENANDFKVGSSVKDTYMSTAVSLVQELNLAYIPFSMLIANQNTSTIVLKDGALVKVNMAKDPEKQIRILQLILNNNLDPTPKTIDLRFSKPLITLE